MVGSVKLGLRRKDHKGRSSLMRPYILTIAKLQTLRRFVSSSTGEQAADNGDNDPLRPGAGGGRKSPVLVRSVGAHYEDTPAIIATNPTWTMDSIYTSTRVWLCIGICRNRTVL